MPFYEYKCQNCGHQFEELQKITDKPLKKCPQCSGKVEKQVSRSAFQLKGGGWYADGYAKSSSKSAETTTPSSAPASKPAETKS